MYFLMHSAMRWNGENMDNYINIAVWSLAIGICLCNFYIYYNRTVLGGFVRALMEKDAFSADSACTLDMISISSKAFIKSALRRGSHSLYGVVACTEENGAYYIPSEKKNKAEKMFCAKGASILMTLVSCILILVAAYLVTLVFAMGNFSGREYFLKEQTYHEQ